MAVDIKSLRIGSHIDFNGRRVKIKAIVEDSVAFDYTQDEKQLYLSPNAYDEFLSPIPITPELLKELGFENLHKSPDDFIKLDKGFLIKFYRIRDSQDDEWRIIAEGRDGVDYGQILCRYLHELEAFLYLTTQTELIPD